MSDHTTCNARRSVQETPHVLDAVCALPVGHRGQHEADDPFNPEARILWPAMQLEQLAEPAATESDPEAYEYGLALLKDLADGAGAVAELVNKLQAAYERERRLRESLESELARMRKEVAEAHRWIDAANAIKRSAA